jgi:hypothetical protein
MYNKSVLYSIAAGSYSGSGIESMSAELPPSFHLRRSKTAPSRRDKYGSYEPQQIIHVNRTLSQKYVIILILHNLPLQVLNNIFL